MRLTPLRAIRKKCLDCSAGSYKEVRKCPCKDCPLWIYRLGKRPNTSLETKTRHLEGKFLEADSKHGICCVA